MRALSWIPAATLALAALVTVPALAGDEDERTVWRFAKQGDERALDVTHMEPELRRALLAQMRDQGWTRVGDAAEGRPPTSEKSAKSAKSEKSARSGKSTQTGRSDESAKSGASGRGNETPASGLLEDLRELVRRGGRLPEGFRPHDAPPREDGPAAGRQVDRAVGVLILGALEAEDGEDDARRRAYRGLLRTYAETLKAHGRREAVKAVMFRLLDRTRDGEDRAAHRAILDALVAEHAVPVFEGPAPQPDPEDAAPKTEASPPYEKLERADIGPTLSGVLVRRLGGAPLRHLHQGGQTPVLIAVVGPVPPGSRAHEAGLREGDRITAVGDEPLTPTRLRRASRVFLDGGQLDLRVVRRDGEEANLKIAFAKE